MFKELIYRYKNSTSLRFLIAGIINTIFGFSLGFLFLIILPFHYSLSIFISTALGVCFNYFMSVKYVFRAKSSIFKVILYFAIYLLMYFLNMLCMYILINQFNMNDIISFTVCAPFIIVLTYLLQKNLVFSR